MTTRGDTSGVYRHVPHVSIGSDSDAHAPAELFREQPGSNPPHLSRSHGSSGSIFHEAVWPRPRGFASTSTSLDTYSDQSPAPSLSPPRAPRMRGGSSGDSLVNHHGSFSSQLEPQDSSLSLVLNNPDMSRNSESDGEQSPRTPRNWLERSLRGSTSHVHQFG